MPFSVEQVKRALDSKAERVSESDVARIVQMRSAVEEKLAAFPPELLEAGEQGALLFAYLESLAQGPLTPEAKQAAGALLYLSAPVDLVPDHEPGGYADDAAVVELAVQRTKATLRAFCEKNARLVPSWLGP